MISTNRILSVVLLLSFAACDSSPPSGTGGTGGMGSGGAGGKGTGGAGGDGVGGHTSGTGGAGAGGTAGKGTGGAGGGGGKGSGGIGGSGGSGSGGAGGGGGNGSGGAGGGGGNGSGGAAGSGGGTAGAGGHAGGSGGAGHGGNGGGGGKGGAGGHGPCSFSATYTLNDGGGLAALVKKTTLSPPAMFQYDYRTLGNGQMQSCTPSLPACGAATKVDVSDVETAMANADVQAAFAATDEPFYGNKNVADGPAFEVVRSTGGKFIVGLECSVASTTCTTTPDGVHALVQLLHQLITQQTADPSCASQ